MFKNVLVVEASDATTSQNGLFIDKYWQVYIGYNMNVKYHVQDIMVRVSCPGVPHIAPPQAARPEDERLILRWAVAAVELW